MVLDRVYPIDDAGGLGRGLGVEVLADRQRKLLLLDPAPVLLLRHCGREAADALAEDDVAERVLERGRRVEAVGPSVALEDGSVLRAPANLRYTARQRNCVLAVQRGEAQGGGHSLLRCARWRRC